MRHRRSTIIVLSVVLIVIIAFGVYFLNSHEAPATQGPLSDLNAQNLEGFKDRFNKASDEHRIILLLSPT